MAAGGFRTFVAGETLDEDKINDFLMQGVLVFADATARDAAITSPVHGQVAFLKDTNETVFYDGTSWEALSAGVEVEYLVIAGGGGGGRSASNSAGGGGAGGYRCSVSGENSGGGVSAESPLFIQPGTYPIIVGAGGAGPSSDAVGGAGSNSRFGRVLSIGGGGGAYQENANLRPTSGVPGGSGGGTAFGTQGSIEGFGIPEQGFRGGFHNPFRLSSNAQGTGGGGAGSPGVDAPTTGQHATNGGAGVSSSIDGSATTRAGGGGGVMLVGTATGGTGGGGNGARGGSSSGGDGTVNTGSGGGGASNTSGRGGNGGSGIVIFRVPTGTSVSFSGGVTHTTATVGDKTAYIVTATSTTDETVTIG